MPDGVWKKDSVLRLDLVQELTEEEIKQFVIRMSKNEDKNKTQAEDLNEAGVTGAALKADYEDGKEAFIKAMKDDHKITSTAFAKTSQ